MFKLTIQDLFYPKILKEINNPPALLYVESSFDLVKLWRKPALAVVGTRHITAYGLWATQKLVGGLVDKGLVIVSGLAKGVDICAHLTALKKGGLTLAVLASGFDHIYPPEHETIAYQISQKGALISEFAPTVKAKPAYFAQRNRIIAGLSLGVLVIEAAEKSGSLITATWAADFGREVFAVPGPINSLYAKGVNQLLQKGAKLVEKVEDILEELKW